MLMFSIQTQLLFADMLHDHRKNGHDHKSKFDLYHAMLHDLRTKILTTIANLIYIMLCCMTTNCSHLNVNGQKLLPEQAVLYNTSTNNHFTHCSELHEVNKTIRCYWPVQANQNKLHLVVVAET